MSRYIIQGKTLTGIADAIRSKAGITNKLTLNDMLSTINNFNNNALIEALFKGYITEFSSEDEEIITEVGKIASHVKKINFPNAVRLDSFTAGMNPTNGISGNTNLTAAILPKLSNLPYPGFKECTNLSDLDVSHLVTIGDYALSKTAIQTLNSSALTTIGDYGVAFCSQLKSVNSSSISYIGKYAFQDCSKLESIDLSSATTIDNYGFWGCSSLTSVTLPLVTTIKIGAFRQCTNLETVDMHVAQSIEAGAFIIDTSLKNIIIRSSEICSLGSSTEFSYSGTNYIYVPAALIDSYKTATNWKNYANRFRALEDYTIDNTIMGELDKSKI